MLGDWSSSAGVRAGGDSQPPDDGASLHRPGARSWTHSQTERGRWAGMRKGKSAEGTSRRGTGLGKARRPEGTSTGHLHGGQRGGGQDGLWSPQRSSSVVRGP